MTVEASQGLYLYLHSANLHATLVFDNCRAIPDFKEHTQIHDACKYVLESPKFMAATNEFPDTMEDSRKACVKVKIWSSHRANINIFRLPFWLQKEILSHLPLLLFWIGHWLISSVRLKDTLKIWTLLS